ncbi:lysophospholipase L1-like esterase [Nocardioides daedukensis]|uniref:Lysophospholipase L1-like esterase n=1 Tax=Nocardioides daedukensis TaxID=634462 RepID=A0A7Y9UN75_9ACTN|nr:SGNH/GDSL hydrolase family protein [Nocardioides daedukensis]NYG58258.1 lysophospholipase L1-like esterase [Nocardioides daedukensis]
MHILRPATACLLAAAFLLGGCTQEDPEPPKRTTSSSEWRESGSPGTTEYVALGDSYAAAPGVPTTDVNNACFPSSNNYPALVAKALEVDRLIDASCGGASTADLLGSQGPGRPPQLDALSTDTTLVTLTVGGNDNGVFAKLLTDCVAAADLDPTGSPCRDGKESQADQSLLKRLDRSADNVDRVLAEIEERAPEALVVVVGYPQMLPAKGTCRDRFPIAEGDFAYAREINQTFNENLKQAAKEHDVEFVDMWSLSRGHDLCSDDPWVNGSTNLPDKAAPYHPFAAEQEAAAQAVVELVRKSG